MLMFQVCSSDPAHHPLPFIALSCSRSSAPRNFSGRFFPPDKLSSNCRQFSSKNCHQLSRISCHHFKRNFFIISHKYRTFKHQNTNLALNQEFQERSRHRRAQYECSAPSNTTTYFLRFIHLAVLFHMKSLSSCFAVFSNVCTLWIFMWPGPPAPRARWWRYIEVELFFNWADCDVMTLLVRKEHIYMLLFVVISSLVLTIIDSSRNG